MISRLKRVRKALQLSQKEMASRLGITSAALSMIETGKAQLTERNRMSMIEIFGVNPDFLDSGKEPILSAAPEIQDIIRQGHEQSLPMQSIPLLKPSPKNPLSQIIRNPQDAEQTSFCHIPALPKCDGAIQIFSNGISEGFRSGDIILFRSIKSIDMVQWGEDYLICFTHGEEERATLRRVYASTRKGYIRLCTSDRDQQDLELEISRIKAIAEVRASIRIHYNL